MNYLFDCESNIEVLDNNCIQTIRKKSLKSSLQQTHAVVTELHSTWESMEDLMDIPGYDKQPLFFTMGGLRSLEQTLSAYQDAQHRLTGELKQLVKGQEFNRHCRTSSEDIGHVIDVLNQMSDGIQCCIGCLLDFNRLQPINASNRRAALMVRYNVTRLIDELQKLLELQDMTLLQLHEWMWLREVHEQQEILN